jgi:2-polyprenyl-3-methyl-5-hydroxy-6-metoxy-1,4-benzoquinol methylase
MNFQTLLTEIDAGRILDVGCGSGQFTEILTGSLNSFESLTGIDVAEEYLSEARLKFPGNQYEFKVASSLELPFENESYDMVAISKALHHVEDPQASLHEMKRVLKPDGYFLINEMHRDQLSEAQGSHMMYHHLRSEIDNVLGISHHQTFHRDDLISLVDGLELRDRVIMEFSPDPSNAKDPDHINDFIRKMDEWFLQLDGHPEKEEFYRRAEDLKVRFRKHGIARPPQMVFLGRKAV